MPKENKPRHNRSKSARESYKKVLDIKQSIGARIYQGTEHLKINLIVRGFEEFLITIRSWCPPSEEGKYNYNEDQRPIFIFFLTPDKQLLGVMALEDRDDALIPGDLPEWYEDPGWATLWELYLPLENEPMKTKMRADQSV